MVYFVDPESAKSLALHETVVFAELMDGAEDARPLEVHVMRPTGYGLYEVERDDTGTAPGSGLTLRWRRS
ncbi:MAG TPA: hypothetical protein VK864_12275 [Longimicrobiales bacterium]|nr:hypothetical protein [Longimicrobiales bacterium]